MRKLIFMRKLIKNRVVLVVVLAIALLTSAIGSYAVTHNGTAAAASHFTTSFKSVSHVPVSHVHDVDVAKLPPETAAQLHATPRALPHLYPGGRPRWRS